MISKYEVNKVQNFVKQIRGVSYKDEDLSEVEANGYVPILRANNIKENKLNSNDIIFVRKERVKEEQLIREGDILVAASSGSKHIVGKAAQAKQSLTASFGAFCKIVRPQMNINSNYLGYYFVSPFYRHTISNLSAGANINNIRNEHIDNLEIPIPPIETQKKIAEVLDKAQELIDKRKAQIEKLDKFLQGVFLDMFGDPVKNPKGWEKKELHQVTTLITDGKHGDCENEEKSGYYFIGAREIANGRINYMNARQIAQKDFEEVHRRTNLEPGDLVIVNTGATIGKTAIAKDNIRTRKTTFQKSVAVIKTNKELLNVVYLKELYNNAIDFFTDKSSGSAQKNLLLSQMRRTEIPLPSIDLQNKFAAIVEKVEQQKELMQKSLTEMENNFNSIMQKAFKGELF